MRIWWAPCWRLHPLDNRNESASNDQRSWFLTIYKTFEVPIGIYSNQFPPWRDIGPRSSLAMLGGIIFCWQSKAWCGMINLSDPLTASKVLRDVSPSAVMKAKGNHSAKQIWTEGLSCSPFLVGCVGREGPDRSRRGSSCSVFRNAHSSFSTKPQKLLWYRNPLRYLLLTKNSTLNSLLASKWANIA